MEGPRIILYLHSFKFRDRALPAARSGQRWCGVSESARGASHGRRGPRFGRRGSRPDSPLVARCHENLAQRAFRVKTLSDLVDLIGFAHWLGYAFVALVLLLVATTTVMCAQDRIWEFAVLQQGECYHSKHEAGPNREHDPLPRRWNFRNINRNGPSPPFSISVDLPSVQKES